MVRLFGNVKGEEEEFSAGRLHFYPTFFDRIGLEVINPHDRKTGTGKQPIYFECVPAGTYGTFTLLYVPLDLIGRREDVKEQAQEDLRAAAEGIRAMLTEYGFGAKTSSGYGVAKVEEKDTQVNPESWREIFLQGWKEACQDTSTT
jgi:CRISPR-associated protein Cmr2